MLINETLGNATDNYRNVTKITGSYYYTETSDRTDKLINFSNILAFFGPLIASIYSKSLYETKCMSRARSNEARISPN